MGPLVPEGSDFAASGDFSAELGGGPAVAGHHGICDVHDGVVVWPLALDCLWGGAWAETGVTGKLGSVLREGRMR